MSADFWSGYVSGAIGILVGNPLDIVKTQLQAGDIKPKSHSPLPSQISQTQTPESSPSHVAKVQHLSSWARGAAAPILGYGALNALLFVTYNRSLALLSPDHAALPDQTPAWSIWTAGALGGLATFVVSAPTELVKCRAQVSKPGISSLEIARDLWQRGGLRGVYLGGGITSMRDAVGYGFYFWSYELSKRAVSSENDGANEQALKVLLCGGLAGVVTWASIFPLDVIKTRVQTWDISPSSLVSAPGNVAQPLLGSDGAPGTRTNSAARPTEDEALDVVLTDCAGLRMDDEVDDPLRTATYTICITRVDTGIGLDIKL
nr:mitochondrial basic amino acids transporter [Quercus suber]